MILEDKPPIPTAATAVQIAHHFSEIPYTTKTQGNWGCVAETPSPWDIPGTTTYINGIMLIIDQDFEMGFLLEICDRPEGKSGETWVTHFAIEIRHTTPVLYQWHDHRPYPFFERPDDVTQFDLHSWFINWYECNQEERRDG
jgi:hypothetical protein